MLIFSNRIEFVIFSRAPKKYYELHKEYKRMLVKIDLLMVDECLGLIHSARIANGYVQLLDENELPADVDALHKEKTQK